MARSRTLKLFRVLDLGDGGLPDRCRPASVMCTLMFGSKRMCPICIWASLTPRILNNLLQLLPEGGDLFPAAQIRLGDDLQQWGAGAVQVNDAVIDPVSAGGDSCISFAGVFFQVGAADADEFRTLPSFKLPTRNALRPRRAVESYWLI